MDIIKEFWASKPDIKNVSKKIQAVMTDVDKLIKDSKNDFQHYNYVSESNAVAKVRESWVKNGLIAIPFTDETKSEQIGGKQSNLVTVSIIYQIIDTDSGEYLLARFSGQGVDAGDKSIYKAITGCNKYFLFKTFQLETTDDKQAPSGSVNPESYTQKKQLQNTAKPYLWRMKTKYEGTCFWCQMKYGVGEDIIKSNDNEVGHAYCFETKGQ